MDETIHYDKYYTCIDSLASIFDKTYRSQGFHGPYDVYSLRRWQIEARRILAKDLGLDVLENYLGRSGIQEELIQEEVLSNEICRRKVLIKLPNWSTIPTYILEPKNPKGVFLCFAGHHSTGKLMTSGSMVCETTLSLTIKYGADFGIELAKKGYVAICPDSVGFGERREVSSQGDSSSLFESSSCKELSRVAVALGISLAGIMVYEGERLIDYVVKKYSEDVPIQVIGFSGGGMQALYLSAIDERIKGAIVSGYFYGFKDSLLYMNKNCSCNYFPGIFRDFDACDIASMIAPRKLCIQSAKDDHLNGAGGFYNVTSQINEANKVFRLFGESIFFDVREGDHAFHKEVLNLSQE